jgi:hypothetical protein
MASTYPNIFPGNQKCLPGETKCLHEGQKDPQVLQKCLLVSPTVFQCITGTANRVKGTPAQLPGTPKRLPGAPKCCQGRRL